MGVFVKDQDINLGPSEIADLILTFRGRRVILDADLAALYGTTTKRLNEQVKRNRQRFPGDFMFRLSAAEKKRTGRNLRPV